MQKTINQEWVSRLAEELLCKITYQMGGIILKEIPDLPMQSTQKTLGIVCGETTGDFNIQMRLETERSLFVRLACNMIGVLPKDQQEVEEYATEFFNIICGRFVSELYHLTGQSAHFLPTTYEQHSEDLALQSEHTVNTVKFISDSGEGAIFSWTLASQGI